MDTRRKNRPANDHWLCHLESARANDSCSCYSMNQYQLELWTRLHAWCWFAAQLAEVYQRSTGNVEGYRASFCGSWCKFIDRKSRTVKGLPVYRRFRIVQTCPPGCLNVFVDTEWTFPDRNPLVKLPLHTWKLNFKCSIADHKLLLVSLSDIPCQDGTETDNTRCAAVEVWSHWNSWLAKYRNLETAQRLITGIVV